MQQQQQQQKEMKKKKKKNKKEERKRKRTSLQAAATFSLHCTALPCPADGDRQSGPGNKARREKLHCGALRWQNSDHRTVTSKIAGR